MFLFSLTHYNTVLFFTRSVQLIFSILLQHHIPKLSGYFSPTFRSVQVSAPYSAVLQMQDVTIVFLKFKSNLHVKRIFVIFNAAFAIAILYLISRVQVVNGWGISLRRRVGVEVFALRPFVQEVE